MKPARRRFRAGALWLWAVCMSVGVQEASARYGSWDWSTGNWTDATRWSSDPDYPNNGHPGPGDTWTVNVSSGTVTRDISPTITTLDFSGGTVKGSGVLTVVGSASWSGGRFEAGNVNFNGGGSITGGATLSASSATLTLASGQTVAMTGSGSLSLDSGAKFTNNGTFLARNDNGIHETGSFQSTFTNNGTVTRDTGTGTFVIGSQIANNHGTINVNSGTLEFQHGLDSNGHIQIAAGASLTLGSASVISAGASFGGSGALVLQNDETYIHPALTLSNPVTLASSAKISVFDGNTLTLDGALNWNGGELSREANIFGGQHGFVTLNGGATVANGSDLFGLTVTNPAAGIVSLAANGTLHFNGDARFSNAGTFSMSSGSRLENTNGSGNGFNNTGSLVANSNAFNPATVGVSLTNSGTVTAPAGWLVLSGGGSSTGTFQAASGAIVKWSGDYDFNAGTTFSGAGSFDLESGSHTLVDSLATSAGFSITSSLAIPGGKSFTHGGALFFSGSLGGGGSLVANSSLGLSGGSVTASTLKISGGAAAAHSGTIMGYTLTLHDGGILRNEGTLTAEDTGGVASGTGSGNRFENAGTFIRNTDTGNYTVSAGFVNTGSVRADTGKLKLTGGGTSDGGAWSVAADSLIELSGSFSFTGGNTVTGAGSWIFGTEGGTGAAVGHSLGGTVSLGAPVTLGNATLTIGPAATVTATAAFDALKGSLTGGGTFHADGGTDIGNLAVNGAALALGTGTGNTHASASPLVLSSGGSVANAGVFEAQGDFNFTAGDFAIAQGPGAAGSFSNSGDFVRDTGTGQYVIGVPFHNSGTVSSQTGLLGVAAGGTSTGGTWDSTGGLLVFKGDFTFDGTTTLTGTSLPRMDEGVYTVNGPFTSAPGLSLAGLADLAVQPGRTVVLAGPLEMAGGLTGVPTVSGGGTVNADGGMTVSTGVIRGATVNLAATATATHTGNLALTLENGGVFNNAGTYQAGGDGSIGGAAAPGNIFHNSGTLVRDISAGVFTISAPLDNTGTVSATSGTLSFTGNVASTGTFAPAAGATIGFSGTSVFDHATPFTGSGGAVFTAGTHDFIQSCSVTPAITVTGGTLNVAAATTLDLTGMCHLAGGTVGGTGALQAGGDLDLSGNVTLDAGTLVVPAGSGAFQTGDGKLTLNGAAVLSNAGIWHAANARSISAGTGTGQTVANSGTFLRDTGTGTFVVAIPLLNTGTVSVATGILSLQGSGSSSGVFEVAADTDLGLSGSNTFSTGAAFTGAGRVNLQAGTQTVGATMASSAIVNLSGATLSVQPSRVFQSNGAFHWTAGPVTGGGTLETSGALDLTTAARSLDGAALSSTATGTITLSAAGTLALSNGGTVNNGGTMMLLNDGSVTAADASAVALDNPGTVTRDSATGLFTIAVPFNHSGVLNLNTGSIAFNGGGTAGNSLIHTGAGTNLYVGTNYTFGPDNFITGTGATHFGNGSLHVTGGLTTDGSFNWTGGTLDGGGTFTVKGGLAISPDGSAVYINGSTLENAPGSEAIISGAQTANILNGGTYRNSGTTRLRGNNNFNDGGGGTNRIVNTGTLVRDQGTGSYVVTVPVENSGLIRSTAGGLYLNAGGSISGGSLDATGGDIYLNGGNYSFAGGSLTGGNWIYLTAGSAGVDADTGSTTGGATGGFGLSGGTLGGTAMLSVERGYFATGNIGGSPTIRLTGESSKAANTQTGMSGGTIRNDGVWTNPAGGNFDLDISGGTGGGTLDNRGTWTLTGAATYSNSHGGGQVENRGVFHATTGASNILGAVHHMGGSTFRCTGGYVLLGGGGTMETGATLDADAAGSIYFNGGTHTLTGGTLTGANHTYAGAGTVVVAGNVGAVGGPATGGFAIHGGTVTGSAVISADHGYFSSGQMSGSATVRLTGPTTKETNTQIGMNGGTILNEGDWTNRAGGNFDLDTSDGSGGGTLDNRGTWTIEAGSTYSNSYGGGQLLNSGLFHVRTGGSNILGAVRHKDGSTFRCTGGYVLLGGGGTMETGATLDADVAGSIYFNGGTHTLTGGMLTGANYTYAGAGTVVVAGNVGAVGGPATGGFAIHGGTVTGSAVISADHGYFSSGQMSGTATIRLTGATTKEMNTQIGMNGGTILNEGSWTNRSGGNFDLDTSGGAGGGTLDNRGTWTIEAGSTYSNSYGGGQLLNSGLFRITAGGSNILGAVHHKNGGTFRCTGGYVYLGGGGTMETGATLDADAAGSIHFNGGTHTLAGGTLTGSQYTYASAGTTVVSGDVGATTGAAAGGFGITGGSVTGTAVISADHGYIHSGQISGTVTIRLTGASIKEANNQVGMNGGTIRNEGTLTNKTGGNFDLDNNGSDGAGTLDNRGTWTIEAGSTYSNSYGGGRLDNHGLFRITAGASNILGAVHHKEGSTFRCTGGYVLLAGGGTMEAGATLDADSSGSIYFNGGTHTLHGGTLTGAQYSYSSAGTTEVSGDVGTTSGAATGGYGITGGSVTGSAMISADHGYFQSGQISGAVTVRLTGAGIKESYTQLNMSGGTILNEGMFTNRVGGNFDTDNSGGTGGGTIDNRGTWTLSGAVTCSNSYGGGQLHNHGIFHAQAGGSNILAGVHHKSGSTFRCTGGYVLLSGGGSMDPGSTLDADTGGYIYFNGGTHTLRGGSLTGSLYTYSSAGTTVVDGDVGATSGPATGGYGIVGGTITGSAMISADHGSFSSGQIDGTVTIRLTGASTKVGYTHLGFSGGILRNDGILTHDPGGSIDLDNSGGTGGGTILNHGTWNITGGVTVSNTYGQGVVTNTGSLSINGGGSAFHVPLANSGSINVGGGYLYLYQGSVHSGAVIANGGIGFITGTHTMSGTSAYLGGSGYSTGTLTLSDGASIRPGNSAGNLTNYGTLSFTGTGAAPSVVVEIASASSYDTITLGNGSLLALGSGITDLTLRPAYQPARGAVFRILDAGTGTGMFTGTFRNAPSSGAVVSATYGGVTAHFRVTYDPAGRFADLTAVTGFDAWAYRKGLAGSDAAFGADPDKDGISNGIEFVIGGEPNPSHPGSDSSALLPEFAVDGSHLRVTFRRSAASAYLNPAVQYDADLTGPWTPAVHGTGGVTVNTTVDGFAPGIDRVETLIPRGHEVDGKLFGRLTVRDSP